MDDINEELSMDYAFIRRQLPAATADEIARRITERLTPAQRLALAEQARLWRDEAQGSDDLAFLSVRNFVLAIETDPDEAVR